MQKEIEVLNNDLSTCWQQSNKENTIINANRPLCERIAEKLYALGYRLADNNVSNQTDIELRVANCKIKNLTAENEYLKEQINKLLTNYYRILGGGLIDE